MSCQWIFVDFSSIIEWSYVSSFTLVNDWWTCFAFRLRRQDISSAHATRDPTSRLSLRWSVCLKWRNYRWICATQRHSIDSNMIVWSICSSKHRIFNHWQFAGDQLAKEIDCLPRTLAPQSSVISIHRSYDIWTFRFSLSISSKWFSTNSQICSVSRSDASFLQKSSTISRHRGAIVQ